MVVFRELDKIFEGPLHVDGLVDGSTFRLGRNSGVGCVLWYRLLLAYCFDGALNPDRGGASLGMSFTGDVPALWQWYTTCTGYQWWGQITAANSDSRGGQGPLPLEFCEQAPPVAPIT